MANQVRFTQLVKASGKPHAAALWVTDPKDDPEFKKAVAEDRIVTIHHTDVGTKRDVAHIGFAKGAGFSYLIFPKALPLAAGTRVIGLKFDMLEDVPVKNPVHVKEKTRNTKAQRVETIDEPEAQESKEAIERKQPKINHKQAKKTPAPKKEEPATSTFKVTLEYRSSAAREVEIEATSASEAIDLVTKDKQNAEPAKPKWEIVGQTVRRLDR